MSKKIGIITITNNGNNYGNVLQNYALQNVITKIGFESETIDHSPSGFNNSFLRFCRIYLGLLKNMCTGKKEKQYIVKRIRAFQRFKKNHISFSNFRIKRGNFPSDRAKKYDAFVFGSDQIWNLKFNCIQQECNIYFGRFTEKKKKIAYAGSFGAAEIPEQSLQYVSESLKDFRYISVREEAGRKLCTQFGIHCEVVPDPTLLLSTSKWRSLEKAPTNIGKQKYLLTYFLGKTSDKLQDEISWYAQENGLELVNLNNSLKFCKSAQDHKLLALGPESFLWLIDHCSAFVTDSFHGSVFSLVFRKPFQVIERVANEENNNMNSRLETLLGLFNEQARLCSGHLNIDLLRNPPATSTEQTHRVLSRQGISVLREQLKKI